mgnify:CR=1 FL=1
MPNAFQYGWMGSTQRLLQVAKAFTSLGFEVTLIASDYSDREIQGQIDSEFPGQVVRTSHSGSYPWFVDGVPALRRLWRGWWRLRGRPVYWLNVSEGWATRITASTIGRLLLRAGNKRPSLVWGISAGLLEGGSAAERIAGYFDCPWVYELHDPPLHAGLQDTIASMDGRFRTLLDSAALIVTNSQTYERSLHANFDVPQAKLRTIFLTFAGTLGQWVAPTNEKLTVGHFGSMNGERSALPLLQNFVALTRREPSLAHRFELIFAGEGSGIDEAIAYMEANGLGAAIKYVGLVPKEQVNELMKRCDALLIIQPDESHLEIPGKLFETMRQLKPVLALMKRDCESAHILVESGLGLICQPGDNQVMQDVLSTLFSKWQAGTMEQGANTDYISEFSADYLPVHLSGAIAPLVAD